MSGWKRLAAFDHVVDVARKLFKIKKIRSLHDANGSPRLNRRWMHGLLAVGKYPHRCQNIFGSHVRGTMVWSVQLECQECGRCTSQLESNLNGCDDDACLIVRQRNDRGLRK